MVREFGVVKVGVSHKFNGWRSFCPADCSCLAPCTINDRHTHPGRARPESIQDSAPAADLELPADEIAWPSGAVRANVMMCSTYYEALVRGSIVSILTS